MWEYSDAKLLDAKVAPILVTSQSQIKIISINSFLSFMPFWNENI
jgi:hypothetical protein